MDSGHSMGPNGAQTVCRRFGYGIAGSGASLTGTGRPLPASTGGAPEVVGGVVTLGQSAPPQEPEPFDYPTV